ncbi:uncharacterized protein G2W53_010543 [Senna tora]|uniref:ATP-dependent DNA helicase n=1 Tax=Senna tora TaxID=362788 RepID=A0A834X0G8_9FABA|nr:uncharacterized protein G2W53_010543 [Senna tora]
MASNNVSLRNKQPLTSSNNSSSNKRSKCNDSAVEEKFNNEAKLPKTAASVSKDKESMNIPEVRASRAREMLDYLNPLVQVFRSMKNHPSTSNRDNLRLKLIKKRQTNTRVYNLPTADEITALIVGDFDPEKDARDIIVEKRLETLQRISELHPLYLPLQYPLLFPRGEDGYREDAVFKFAIFSSTNKEKNLTLRQYFTYILQDRRDQFNIFLRSRKLTQQFIVDGCTMIESQRLLYIRLHQKELRADSYTTLTHALARGQTTSSGIDKRIVLPSTFTGGSDLAELMVHTKLIIWDEAPVTHRHCFGVLDRTLRDIMKSQNPELSQHTFGGKVIVFGGDFRQILPVIPRASRQDIVLVSLNASYLRSSCKVLSLTKNMRLATGNRVEENESIARFAEWILKIGDGTIGNIINDEEH